MRAERARQREMDGEACESIANLYRAYAPWLLAFLARRFGPELADDLAQDTFLRLSKAPTDWRSPKALLARVAISAGLDHIRRETADKRPRLVSDQNAPDAVTHPEQFETLLHRQVVSKLPPPLQDVYCLHRFVGLTYPEIAEHLGISVKAVEKRMAKALRLCIARYLG